MNIKNQKRVDEVSQYYNAPKKLGLIGSILFWIVLFLSLSILFLVKYPELLQNLIKSVFIIFVFIHFIISQANRFFLIPIAERMRRKQMLSNAFGTPLSHDKTSMYYNNNYSPSINRLGANTMENALFSSSVAKKMLVKKRFLILTYLVIWIFLFSIQNIDLNVLILITQTLFSGEIIIQWISLEVLRFRHDRVYNKLHQHFHKKISGKSPIAIATILDSFAAYESAKSSSSYLLSTNIFNKLNPTLTEKWEQVRKELNMK